MAIATLALAACGPKAAAPEAASVDGKARKRASSYVRGTVRDVYRSIRRGKADTEQSLLATNVFAVGPGPAQVYRQRTDAVLALTAAFDAGKRRRLRSRGLVAQSSATGKSAWVVDRIDIGRARYTVVAVLAEVEEIWYVVALHVGATTTGKRRNSRRENRGRNNGDKGNPTPAPATAGLPALTGGTAPAAEPVVDLIRAAAPKPLELLASLSKHKLVTIVGPHRNDHLRGGRTIKRAWKRKRRSQAPAPFSLEGVVRSGVTPDGGLAWVIANTRPIDAADGPMHRRMFVYRRSGEEWRLVVMQDAIPTPL